MMSAAMNAPLDGAAASPNDAAEPLDLVFLEGFAGSTVIGIHESELHLPQTVLIDVCAGLPRVAACDTDRIADTLDYGELRLRLQRLMSEHGVQLLEALDAPTLSPAQVQAYLWKTPVLGSDGWLNALPSSAPTELIIDAATLVPVGSEYG